MVSVKEGSIAGKRILIWSDLDTPMEGGQVADDTRLKKSSETLNYLRGKASSIVILGHLGRPEGRDPKLSLKKIADRFEIILGTKIEFLNEITQPSTNLAMLENIRFWPGEEKNDLEFATRVAALGEVFVNDCFSTCHHGGATMNLLPRLLPSYSGVDLQREVDELSKTLKNPERPFVAVVGGAKLETKLPVITNLAKTADSVLVGGKLMFEVNKQTLPPNVVVAEDDIDGKDIGKNSIDKFVKHLSQARTVVWNGPMGLFEEPKYMDGTAALARAVAENQGYTIVGGGDTISAMDKLGLLEKVTFISAGGGAMLEFLAGKKLPGLEALGFYDH